MKKAIIVLLVAVVAMTAVFANTSGKDGFAIKADAIGLTGTYSAAYRLGNFEFGIGYMTGTIGYAAYRSITAGSIGEMRMTISPAGTLASVEYKFVATEHHEVGALAEVGYTFVGPTVAVGIEYDFCINQNHAVYVKAAFPCLPFAYEFALYLADIGYRYTF